MFVGHFVAGKCNTVDVGFVQGRYQKVAILDERSDKEAVQFLA